MSDANGAGEASTEDPPRPLPFLLSCAFGVLGFVLLAIGVLLGSTGLAVAGFAAGSLSLGAALYWRSLLISAWEEQKRGRPPR